MSDISAQGDSGMTPEEYLRRLVRELEDRNAFLERTIRHYENDHTSERLRAAVLSSTREQRHHEVLCLVLGKAIKTAHPSTFELAVEHARRVADLAYPPPSTASVPAVTYLSEAAIAAISAASSVTKP